MKAVWAKVRPQKRGDLCSKEEFGTFMSICGNYSTCLHVIISNTLEYWEEETKSRISKIFAK